MGWLRNLLVFPDKIWEDAAGKLDGDFSQGKGLANSEIKLSHRDVPVTLGVDFSSDSEDSAQVTKAIPKVSLRPDLKLLFYPRMKGVAGSLTSGLLSKTGKGIDLPLLGEDYHVIGDNGELASELFGHPDFVAALRGMSTKPTVAVGGRLSSWENGRAEEDEENLFVSVPSVLKDVRELIAMVALTKVLLDLLVENGCLA